MTEPADPGRRKALSLWLPVLAWLGVIFFLSAQPDLPHPESGWADWLLSSSAHALEYALLAILLVRAVGPRPRAGLLVLCAALAYALSDELHQAFVPGRHPDPVDLVCDAAGVLLGLAVCRLWSRRARYLPLLRPRP